MATQKKLIDLFENADFNVHLFEQDNQQCAELETWTNGGVNMIITLMPFNIEEFKRYVKNFNVDEEIDLHRQDERYKNAFTIKQSVKDFEDFQKRLKKVKKDLKKILNED